MKPYYQDDLVTLYHGDCSEVLSQLPRGLMVTDPPYNVGYHYGLYKDRMEYTHYWAWLGRVVRMPVVFIHYPEALFSLSLILHRSPDEIVAWVYHANTPKQWRGIGWFGIAPDLSLDWQEYQNPNDKRVRQLIALGKKARLYDWWHVEQIKNVSDEKTSHPCQIPISLMTRILRVTPHDGPVIDPFAGSGTTLQASTRLGRKSIGIELDESYCEIAANRLRQGSLSAMFQ